MTKNITSPERQGRTPMHNAWQNPPKKTPDTSDGDDEAADRLRRNAKHLDFFKGIDGRLK